MKGFKLLYKLLGLFFVGLGILGAFLPILPTTPFLLLALWFFSRSSEKLERWLLTNKLCGSYISDYKSGRGIPARVKVYILALLWGCITYSAMIVNPIWLKALLFIIALGVTVHVLRFKTKREKKILVLIPSYTEMEKIGIIEGAIVKVSGVGMAETAAAVSGIEKKNCDFIILAGICGAYPSSGLSKTECIVVNEEAVADLGAQRDGGFEPLYEQIYPCPYVVSVSHELKQVRSNTVSISGRISDSGTASVENMEGAAFFAACLKKRIPFLEVRAISNFACEEKSEWVIDDACRELKTKLQRIIDEIKY